MKIKLNKETSKQLKLLSENKENYINEEAAATADNDEGNKEIDEIFKRMFITDKQRDNLVIQYTLPDQLFNLRFSVKRAPMDLRDLLQKVTGNKIENARKMLDDNPEDSYAYATDYAVAAFTNLDEEPKLKQIDRETKKTEETEGEISDNVKEKTEEEKDKEAKELAKNAAKDASVSNESFIYNTNVNSLNESALFSWAPLTNVTTTLMNTAPVAGAIVGNAAAKVTFATMGFTGTMLACAAPAIITLIAAGFVGQKMFGDVDAGVGRKYTSNNKAVAASHEETETAEQTNNNAITHQGKNAIKAIEIYLTNLINNLGDVFNHTTNDDNDKKVTELINEIQTFISNADDKVAEYLDNNSTLIKKAREEYESKQEQRADKAENKFNLVAKVSENIINLCKDQPERIGQLINALNTKADKLKFEEREKLKNSDNIEEITKILISKNSLPNISDSVQYNNMLNNLNEDNENNEDNKNKKYNRDVTTNRGEYIGPAGVNFSDYYNKVYERISTSLNECFVSKLSDNKVASTKKCMETLIEGADKVIKSKIEIVCRATQQGQTGGWSDNKSLGERIASFIRKHPMKASELTLLWERHKAELDTRMEMRLDQLKDMSNETRIGGWATSTCKTVIPEIIAGLLTYRYLLKILNINGVYTYDSMKEREDEKYYDNHRGEIKQSLEFKVLGAFYKASKDYTDNGQLIFKPTEKGFEYNAGAILAYASLLLFNIQKGADTKQQVVENPAEYYIQTSTNLLQICKEGGDINKLINALMMLVCQENSTDFIFGDKDYEGLVEIFQIDEGRNKEKTAIKEYFDKICELGEKIKADESITNEHMCKSLAMIATSPNIILLYNKNKTKLLDYKEKFYNAQNDNEKNEAYNNIKNIFTSDNGCLIDKEPEDITNLDIMGTLGKPSGPVDYYAYIMSYYQSLGMNNFTKHKNNNYISKIQNICKYVYSVIDLLGSNILCINKKVGNPELAEVKNILNTIQSPSTTTVEKLNYFGINFNNLSPETTDKINKFSPNEEETKNLLSEFEKLSEGSKINLFGTDLECNNDFKITNIFASPKGCTTLLDIISSNIDEIKINEGNNIKELISNFKAACGSFIAYMLYKQIDDNNNEEAKKTFINKYSEISKIAYFKNIADAINKKQIENQKFAEAYKNIYDKFKNALEKKLKENSVKNVSLNKIAEKIDNANKVKTTAKIEDKANIAYDSIIKDDKLIITILNDLDDLIVYKNLLSFINYMENITKEQ